MSSPVIRLRTDDFNVAPGTKGPILCTSMKGLVIVLFWSPGCEICKILEPRFRYLPQIINGCTFCTLNINENQGIIALSRETIAPIDFVPYIVAYVNGKPFLRYDDETSFEKLVPFIQYVMKLVESKKSFIDKGAKVESDIPPYSIAKGYHDFKCDEAGFCYLTYSEAYGPKAQTKIAHSR